MSRDGSSRTGAADETAHGGGVPVELTYWNQCERGESTDLRSFIRRHELHDPGRIAAVIRMDMRYRWLHAEPVRVEAYIESFPEVARDEETAFELVYSEYLLREQIGQPPTLEEYSARFPSLTARLRMQVDLHEALAELEGASDADDAFDTEASVSDGARPIPEIPGYEILGVVGHGGMGIVYKARQVGLNRVVALKMVLAGDYARQDQLARFHAEAEAVARLHHPNLVQIYDLGECDGLPFLSLEFVEGGTLADVLAAGPLAPREAAELVRTLAQAIGFAHLRGIVHRDLKPANILLEPGDDNRPRGGEASRLSGRIPKIADFGLAKLVAEGSLSRTETGVLVGTPGYMSPEQISGRGGAIGPVADIYSLGSILYEMLTGRPPFRAATLMETLQLVVSSEPPSLSRLQPRTPRDLATICLKCLEKEPHKRYASAQDLADDLGRFLLDQPIRARRVASWERTWRWCRRNPLTAGLVSAVATLLLAVSVVTSYYSWRLHGELEQTAEARTAERTANRSALLNLWESYLAEASARNSSGQAGQKYAALTALENARGILEKVGRTEARIETLRNAAIASLALPDLKPEVRWRDVPPDVMFVSPPSRSERAVLAFENGEYSLHRLPGGELVYRFREAGEPAREPLLSPGGRLVALESHTATTVWRLEDTSPVRLMTLEGFIRPAFSPDERYLTALDASGHAHLFDVDSGQALRQLGTGECLAAGAFDSAGGRVAVAGRQSIQIVDVQTGEIVGNLPGRLIDYAAAAWHPSGRYLAAGSYQDGVALWDVERSERLMTFGHSGQEMQLAFDAGGDSLMIYTTWNGWGSVWHTGTGLRVIELPDFRTSQPAVGPDGRLTLHRLEGSSLETWTLDAADGCSFLPVRRYMNRCIAFHLAVGHDDRLLAFSNNLGLELWDLDTREKRLVCPLGPTQARFDTAGNLTLGMAEGIHRWIRATGESPDASNTVHFLPAVALSGTVAGNHVFDMSGDGRIVTAELAEGGWSVLDTRSPGLKVPLPIAEDMRDVCVTRDGSRVATSGWNSIGVAVWDTATGRQLARLPVGAVANSRFSPDGKWLATTPNGVELWRTSDWSPGPKLHAQGTAASGLWLAFSPDGRTLAVVQPNGTTRLVDVESGNDVGALYHPRMRRMGVPVFTSDGARLLMASGDDGTVQIWDLAVIRAELRRLGLDWDHPPLARKAPRPAAPLSVTLELGDSLRRASSEYLVREAHGQSSVNQMAEAIATLRRAVEIAPDYALANNNLAWLLLTSPPPLRDADGALRHARHSVRLVSGDPISQNTLGLALYRSGHYREAVDVLEANRVPNRAMLGYDLYILAMSYQQLGDRPRATATLDEACRWQDEAGAALPGDVRLELDAFRAEAEQVLGPLDLPDPPR